MERIKKINSDLLEKQYISEQYSTDSIHIPRDDVLEVSKRLSPSTNIVTLSIWGIWILHFFWLFVRQKVHKAKRQISAILEAKL